jgi:hypothetical protein
MKNKSDIILYIAVILLLIVEIFEYMPSSRILEIQAIPQVSAEELYYDSLVERIIWCESRGRNDVIGDRDYIYQAHGLIQVQERTWAWLSSVMGFKGDMRDPQDQRDFLRLALERGYGNLWTCYKFVKN